MSSLERHPDADNLLFFADGELPARQARKIRSHLQSCWQCRTELEEMQKVVGESVRYRKTVLQTHLPAPPAAWGDLSYKFDEIDASLDRPSWRERLGPSIRWVPVAAALALAWVGYNQLRDAPSVEAAALLRKAVAAADTAPAPARRVRIRTRRQTVIRPAAMKSAETGPLEPLSARSYQEWRDRLPEKQDAVATVEGKYQIRTSTPSGDLAEATLELRIADLHPVQQRLEFRNHDWVEIEEVQQDAMPPARVASESVHPSAAVPALDAPANSEEIRQPAPAATVGDELSVLVALHNIGADLGDPVEVKRQNGQILVAGIGVDPRRRQEIEQALGARPNVVVRFSDPEGTAPKPEKPAPVADSPSADVTALQGQIEKQAGGRANYERLATGALDSSESMMSRAYALRRIAERFPPSMDAQMTAADRQLLRDLYHEHATALARQAAEIDNLLKPVLAPLGGKADVQPPSVAESWQAGTDHLFTIARRVDALLAVMLGVAPAETTGRDIPSQVLSSLAQLRLSAEVYGPAGNSEPRP